MPSPDDNPGMMPQDGIEPPLALDIRQPRRHCATGASICSFRDSAELLPTPHVAQFIPTRLAQTDWALLFVAELFTASFARHKLALGAGLVHISWLTARRIAILLPQNNLVGHHRLELCSLD